MTVKAHYEHHLGNFYSWMSGDFAHQQQEFQQFLERESITPTVTKKAIDLGAGHGIQSVALAKSGFEVLAVDFNDQLLTELKSNAGNLSIKVLNDDIRNIHAFAGGGCDVIACCGDTLAHLGTKKEIKDLLTDISLSLIKGGKVILSFRDYSAELTGDNRFIPVKSDETRILSCMLEYFPDTVRVTDLVYEKAPGGWMQKVSSYHKVRTVPQEVVGFLTGNGMQILFNAVINRMVTIVAVR